MTVARRWMVVLMSVGAVAPLAVAAASAARAARPAMRQSP
jgi:hypothetical protein